MTAASLWLHPAPTPVRPVPVPRVWHGPVRGRHRPSADRTPVKVLLAAHRPAPTVEGPR